MTTMNISLPDALKSFVDEQIASRGYGTSSEYVRELLRKDQDRQRPRGLVLGGATQRIRHRVKCPNLGHFEPRNLKQPVRVGLRDTFAL